MTSTGLYSEEAVRKLLDGGEARVCDALVVIDRHYRNRVCGMVRHRMPGLSSEDLADTWSKTLYDVFIAVREKRLDSGKSLLPWLQTVAYRKAVDCVRRTTTREQALERATETIKNSVLAGRWDALKELEQKEVMALIREAISKLPGKQRTVFQVFVDNYDATRDMEVLRQEVSAFNKSEETMAGVKRALQEGRAKVREFLRQKGYDFGRQENE